MENEKGKLEGLETFYQVDNVIKQNWTLVDQSLQSHPVSHKKPEMSRKIRILKETHTNHEIETELAPCPSQQART